MSEPSLDIKTQLKRAVDVLRLGGVIAYPTEYCFGLGCDPNNASAIERLLVIKRRNRDQGVILIASSVEQLDPYVDLNTSPILDDILNSWPGPNTWLLPARDKVSPWVRGKHSTVAVRVTAHRLSHNICRDFGGPIVSTSANRHAQDALISTDSVAQEMGMEVDFIVNASVGGANQASTIRDGITGKQLR